MDEKTVPSPPVSWFCRSGAHTLCTSDTTDILCLCSHHLHPLAPSEDMATLKRFLGESIATSLFSNWAFSLRRKTPADWYHSLMELHTAGAQGPSWVRGLFRFMMTASWTGFMEMIRLSLHQDDLSLFESPKAATFYAEVVELLKQTFPGGGPLWPEPVQKSVFCDADLHEECTPKSIDKACYCSCHPGQGILPDGGAPPRVQSLEGPPQPSSVLADIARSVRDRLQEIQSRVGNASVPKIHVLELPSRVPRTLKEDVDRIREVWDAVRAGFPGEVPEEVLFTAFELLLRTRGIS